MAMYRDINPHLSHRSAVATLHEIKQKRDRQTFREHEQDIRRAMSSSASEYLKDDNENPV